MQLLVDFRSDQPIYLQIVEQIRQMITTGKLQPGDQLPTVRQLATDLRVNFNTIARAYRILDENGLISTQQGRGTYIWQQPNAEASQTIRKQGLSELADLFVDQARNLGYNAAETKTAFLQSLTKWKDDLENG